MTSSWAKRPSGPRTAAPSPVTTSTSVTRGAERAARASESTWSAQSRSSGSTLSPSTSPTRRGRRSERRIAWTARYCDAPAASTSARASRFQRASERTTRPRVTRGREGSLGVGAPVPAEGVRLPLVLERAEEAVDPERRGGVVVGARQARHHLAAEPVGPQRDAPPAHRDPQVIDGEEVRVVDARPPEVGDLVRTERRPTQDVAEPPLRQVNDLREDRSLGRRVLLLGAEVRLDAGPQRRVGVAEAPEEVDARGAEEPVHHHAEVAAGERRVGVAQEGHEQRERPRELGRPLRRERREVVVVELPGGVTARDRVGDAPPEQRRARPPR